MPASECRIEFKETEVDDEAKLVTWKMILTVPARY